MRRNDRRPDAYDRRSSYSGRERGGAHMQYRDREPFRGSNHSSHLPARPNFSQRGSDSFGGDRSPVISSPTTMASSVRGDSKPENVPDHVPSPCVAKPPSTPVAASDLEKDISRMISLLCDRLYWYLQRDNQDKKEKKMREDLERCKIGHPESSATSEVLRLQLKQTEKEKSKCCARVGAADAKFMAAAMPFLDQLKARAPQPGEQKSTSQDLDAKLENMRGLIMADFAQKIGEKSSQMLSSARSETESQTKELKHMLAAEMSKNQLLQQRVDAERSKSDQLQQRIDKLEKRFDALDLKEKSKASSVSKNDSAIAHLNARVDSTVRANEQLSAQYSSLSQIMTTQDQLEAILNDFDEKISSSEEKTLPSKAAARGNLPGSKTRQRLEDIHAKVQGLQSDGLKLSKEISESIKLFYQRLDVVDKALQAPSPNQTGPRPPASYADAASQKALEERIQHFTKMQINTVSGDLQEKLKGVAKQFGGFIDKERQERQAIAEAATIAQALTNGLCKELETLKHSSSQMVENLEKKLNTQQAKANIHALNVDAITNSVAITAECKAMVDELAMQMQCVTAWQTNFNTKFLYRDIVEHINATLPSGIKQQLSGLAGRLETVEGQLRAVGEGSIKKRKMQQNGAASYGGS